MNQPAALPPKAPAPEPPAAPKKPQRHEPQRREERAEPPFSERLAEAGRRQGDSRGEAAGSEEPRAENAERPERSDRQEQAGRDGTAEDASRDGSTEQASQNEADGTQETNDVEGEGGKSAGGQAGNGAGGANGEASAEGGAPVIAEALAGDALAAGTTSGEVKAAANEKGTAATLIERAPAAKASIEPGPVSATPKTPGSAAKPEAVASSASEALSAEPETAPLKPLETKPGLGRIAATGQDAKAGTAGTTAETSAGAKAAADTKAPEGPKNATARVAGLLKAQPANGVLQDTLADPKMLPQQLSTETGAVGRTGTPPAMAAASLQSANGGAAVPTQTIALQIARHAATGTNRFEIRLDPPELGRVDVRMEVANDGRVTAHLTVERAETLDMLQRDARALEKALNDAGLDADGEGLSFSLEGGDPDQEWSDGNGSDGSALDRGLAADEEAARIVRAALPQTASGGIDIRV